MASEGLPKSASAEETPKQRLLIRLVCLLQQLPAGLLGTQSWKLIVTHNFTIDADIAEHREGITKV